MEVELDTFSPVETMRLEVDPEGEPLEPEMRTMTYDLT